MINLLSAIGHRGQPCLWISTWCRQAVCASVGAVLPRSNNDQVRMVQTKFLRYIAVPTNRTVSFKYVLELIQNNRIPGQQVSSITKESRPMVHPMQFWKSLSAIDAILVAIPTH